jgi:hypothetical protein
MRVAGGGVSVFASGLFFRGSTIVGIDEFLYGKETK